MKAGQTFILCCISLMVVIVIYMYSRYIDCIKVVGTFNNKVCVKYFVMNSLYLLCFYGFCCCCFLVVLIKLFLFSFMDY